MKIGQCYHDANDDLFNTRLYFKVTKVVDGYYYGDWFYKTDHSLGAKDKVYPAQHVRTLVPYNNSILKRKAVIA